MTKTVLGSQFLKANLESGPKYDCVPSFGPLVFGIFITAEKLCQEMVERPYLPPLKAHYERILYPLDIFEREEQKKMQLVKEEQEKEVKKEENGNTEQQKEYKPHNIPRLEMRKLSIPPVPPSCYSCEQTFARVACH